MKLGGGCGIPPAARASVCDPVAPTPLRPLLPLPARPPQELAQAFGAGDLGHAAELTTQLRYVCRIKEAILDKM